MDFGTTAEQLSKGMGQATLRRAQCRLLGLSHRAIIARMFAIVEGAGLTGRVGSFGSWLLSFRGVFDEESGSVP